MMKYIGLSVFVSLITLISFGQEEDEACMPPNKKIQKKITQAVNSKSPQEVVGLFNEAIEMDEENAAVYFEYAMYAYDTGNEYYKKFPDPRRGDRSFSKAEEMFMVTVDLCPEYHASCYYYLGVINYTQQDIDQAVKWFEEFKSFNSTDQDKYPDDYSKKLADVNEVLADFKQEEAMTATEVPFNPVIVKNVSTSEQEYFPMISPDNELIFYTRKGDRAHLGDMTSNVLEEFTFSKRRNIFEDFTGGEALPNPFNDGSVQSYGAASLSVDNKEMVLCACKKEEVYGQSYMNCDLYSTTFEYLDGNPKKVEWTPLVNLGDKINTKNGWEGQPSLSADGNTLFYTVNRPTSQNNDVYIVERDDDGAWGYPRPFNEINTPGKDKSPFLHQDSETLYFVSECTKERPGVGGLDIFYMRKEGDKWSEPKNIGYPINTKDDELGLFVALDGKLAYYSSRQGGNWNIYSFELYAEARPQSVALIKGDLLDDNGQPMQDVEIEIMYEGSDEVSKVKVNGSDGKYAAIVKKKEGQDVILSVKKDGYAFDSKLIESKDLDNNDPTIRDKDMDVRKLKVGEAYTINEILYATSSDFLSNKSKLILKSFANFLKENPTISVGIQGHTDDVGDANQNLILSQKRAKEVRRYLVSLGINDSRLTDNGFGETMPKVENDSESNRALNRRTDFVILGL